MTVDVLHSEEGAAFRSAERTPVSWLFECRLSPLTSSHLALAAKVRSPPLVPKCA